MFVFNFQEFAGCLNLQEEQEVLDLGCGPGGSTFYLADVSNNFKERQFTTLELGSIIVVVMLTCWALPFNVGLKIGQFYQKKHYKTTLEGRKTGTRAVWPKLGVLECGLDIFPCVLSSFLLGMELKDIYSCKKLINNYYSTSARWIWVGYNHLVSNTRELNNCFIENAHKISKILADFICKNNQFWACF